MTGNTLSQSTYDLICLIAMISTIAFILATAVLLVVISVLDETRKKQWMLEQDLVTKAKIMEYKSVHWKPNGKKSKERI